MRCTWCGRRVWVWPWRIPQCRDEDACVARHWVLLVEEGVLPEPEPIDHEQPPEDIDVCGRCRGQGSVPVRQDWETGVVESEQCGWCLGTGKEPVCLV